MSGVAHIIAPRVNLRVGGGEQFLCFLNKYRQHLLINVIADISERILGSGALEERLVVENHAEHEETFDLELDLAADAADIFEVRGYPRKTRGTCLPVALTEYDKRASNDLTGRDTIQSLWLGRPGGKSPGEMSMPQDIRSSDDGTRIFVADMMLKVELIAL